MDDFVVLMNDVARRMSIAAKLADQYAVSMIEGDGVGETIDGVVWYDVRLMLDPREYCAESIDMAREAIDYALERRLIARHPEHKHMLRVVRR